MIAYPQYRKLPADYLKQKIDEYLAEDIPTIDVTAEGIFDKNAKSTAYIQAQQDLIFAGAQLFEYFFADEFEVKVMFEDGAEVKDGEIMAEISGSTAEILAKERVLLNLLQRVCGIATLTRQYSAIANPHDVKILDTRKTTPGIRLFEKYAVVCGGGYNHRMDLSAGILIKDNHIKAAGSVKNVIDRIKSMNYSLPTELEVDTFDQLREGLEAGADGFLLDNMSPERTIEAVKIVRDFPGGDDLFIESSGGITLETLAGYLTTGINAISIGALTHSTKSAEIHMEFKDD